MEMNRTRLALQVETIAVRLCSPWWHGAWATYEQMLVMRIKTVLIGFFRLKTPFPLNRLDGPYVIWQTYDLLLP